MSDALSSHLNNSHPMSTPHRRQGSLALKNTRKSEGSDSRICVYIRSSTKEQVNSLAAQEESNRNFATEKGLEISEIFVEQTTATKGSFIKRPKVKEMLAHMKKHGITTILVLRVDRGFRSTSDFYLAAAELDRLGINIRLADPDIDTNTPAGKMMLTVFVGIAEFESKVREARQLDAFEVMRRERRPRNNNPPYGWKIGTCPKGDPLLIPIITEQKVLSWMMVQYERNCTFSDTARDLNKGGIPTKKKGEIINGKECVGEWHPLTVQRVLEHAVFATEEELAAAQ
jgi:DNA invertase Pin-like site-specific DNA recombinase